MSARYKIEKIDTETGERTVERQINLVNGVSMTDYPDEGVLKIDSSSNQTRVIFAPDEGELIALGLSNVNSLFYTDCGDKRFIVVHEPQAG